MVSLILAISDAGNDFLSEGTKPIAEPMLTYCQCIEKHQILLSKKGFKNSNDTICDNIFRWSTGISVGWMYIFYPMFPILIDWLVGSSNQETHLRQTDTSLENMTLHHLIMHLTLCAEYTHMPVIEYNAMQNKTKQYNTIQKLIYNKLIHHWKYDLTSFNNTSNLVCRVHSYIGYWI